MDHWPRFDDKKSRSRCHLKCGCLTHVECIKCGVKLCLSTKRNCFFAYHHHHTGSGEPPHGAKAIEKTGISDKSMVIRKSGRNKPPKKDDQVGICCGAVDGRKRSALYVMGAYQHSTLTKPPHRNKTVSKTGFSDKSIDTHKSGRNKRFKKDEQSFAKTTFGAIDGRKRLELHSTVGAKIDNFKENCILREGRSRSSKLLFFNVLGLKKK